MSEDHGMALRIGGLPLLTPSDLAAAGRSLLGWTDEAVQVVADLPTRVAALVTEAERLVSRVGDTLDRVDAAVDRVEGVVDRVEGVVGEVTTVADGARGVVAHVDDVAGRAAEVAEGAAGVVDRVGRVADDVDRVVTRIVPVTGAAEALLESGGTTAAQAHALLESLRPVAERGVPLLTHFVDEFSVQELHALIRLVDQVPRFTEHMEADIMPVLARLDQVGPDVHELLDVLKDVRLAIQGVPGFALFRRRGAEKEDELADERPETPPPVDR
jgi:ABC-type transporter Mla subunit MlaD